MTDDAGKPIGGDLGRRIDDLFDGVEFEPCSVTVCFRENIDQVTLGAYLLTLAARIPVSYTPVGPLACEGGVVRQEYLLRTDPGKESELIGILDDHYVHCAYRVPKRS